MKLNQFQTKLLLVFLIGLLLPNFGLSQKPTLIPDQQGHIKAITDMATSPNNRLLATVGLDKQLIIWNYQQSQLLRKVKHSTALKAVWFEADDKVMTLDEENTLVTWAVSTGSPIQIFHTVAGEVQDYAFNTDHSTLALRDKAGSLSVWDCRKGQKLWQQSVATEKGLLYFDKKEENVLLRNPRGRVLAVFTIQNGSEVALEADFFEAAFSPQKEGIQLLHKAKAIYTGEQSMQLVDFAQELSLTLDNNDHALQLVSKGGFYDSSIDPEQPLPLVDFFYSSDGRYLYLKRLAYVAWSTGVSHEYYYFNLTRIDLKTGEKVGQKITDYAGEFIHLTADGKYILTVDDTYSIHYRKADAPDEIVQGMVQPEIFHSKMLVSEDLGTIGMHRFDQYGVRVLDIQNRAPWAIAPKNSCLTKGPKTYLESHTAYNVNSAISAQSKPITLINFRKVPYSAPVVGGPLDFVAVLDEAGNQLGFPYNFYVDELSLSPDEKYAIGKWYLADEDGGFSYGVADIYGDGRRHGDYELAAWNYEDVQVLKSDSPYYGDTYEAKFLQTPTGINRFQAFHFAEASLFAINRVNQKKTQSWNLSTGELLAEKRWPDKVAAIDFLSNGQEALVSFANGKMVHWNTRNGQLLKEWTAIGTFFDIKVSRNDKYVTLRNKGHTAIFDLQKNKMLVETGHDRPSQTTMFGLDGVYIGRNMGEVSDVQVDDKNDRAITAYFDGHVTFWDLAKGQELASLYTIDSTDWVSLSPSGLFDATPGAMNRLYFVIGTEVVELEQLKERYFEPGLLQKLMGFSSEQIRPVNNLDKVDLYPRITEATQIKGNSLQVKLEERNGGIGPVSIFVNGKEVTAEANPLPRESGAKRASEFSFDLQPYKRLFLKNPKEKNTVTLRAFNEAGWLKSAAYNITYNFQVVNNRGSGNSAEEVKLINDPKLYVVCIGTSEYTGDQLDLRFADQDARSMAAAFNASGAALFSAKGDSVEVFCLTTDTENKVEPSIHWQFSNKKNIQSTFQQIAKKAKAEDILAVYLSGHGVTYGSAEKAQFHYLTQGVASEDLSDNFIRDAYTLSGDELTQLINSVPALKQVLIVDACNSGQIVSSLQEGRKSLNSSQIRALDRMKDRTGMFVLSGSAANKVSYEASQYGQGLLTFSLLQGMKLVTARSIDAHLDVMQLFQHARDQVPDLARGIGGIQRPVLAFPSNGSSFDIGIVNDQVKIPIAHKKPVFIRNVFLEENAYDDVIGLGNELANYFQRVSSRGANAAYIFVDVNQFDNAYSIKGIYSLSGNKVNLKGALFKGNKNMGTFGLKGRKDDIKTLVEDLISEVEWLLE